MTTYFLSRRDERRARKLRVGTPASDVSEEIVLEDEPDADIKKTKDGLQVAEAPLEIEVPSLEHRHPTHIA